MLAPFTIMRWFLTYFPISAAAFQCNCNITVFTLDGEVDKDNSEQCHEPISKFDEELWHKCETDALCYRLQTWFPDGQLKSVELGCYNGEALQLGHYCGLGKKGNRSTPYSECCSSPDSEFTRDYFECEADFFPMVLPEDNQIDNPSAFTYWPLIFLLLIAIIIVIYFGYKYYQKRKQPQSEQPETSPLNPTSADPESQILDHSGPHGTMTTGLTDTPSRIVSEQFNSGECTSGTGPANPVERTICREIKRKFVIGEGRFGKVWVGEWQGKDVACKIFDSRDDASWQRETKIYRITLINHEYILKVIATDTMDTGLSIDNWLITDYHERGSLFKYLSTETVSLQQSLQLMFSAVSGIEHLHKEIKGGAKSYKPKIAHRDIKSKNILVSNHGDSIIADLGFAITYDSKENKNDLPQIVNPETDRIKVGTRRYMAPEVLDFIPDAESNVFIEENFQCFLNSDIYSLGLVLWEISSRTIVDDIEPQPYKMPFEDLAPNDPDVEQMRQIVSVKNERPEFRPELMSHLVMQSISELISECLNSNPSCRQGALRLRKSIDYERKKISEEVT